MSKILPYVYRLTKPSTGEFYIGSRCKNKCPPEEDLGKIYFTSSKYVRPIFSEFEIEILAVFFEPKWAYIYEQQLIFENWDNKLKLNRKYHLNSESLCVGPEHHSEATKRKMSISRKGIVKNTHLQRKYEKRQNGETPQTRRCRTKQVKNRNMEKSMFRKTSSNSAMSTLSKNRKHKQHETLAL